MKKMTLSNALDNLSLNKRIKTIAVLDFLLSKSWVMIPVLLVNLVFTWFFIMSGSFSSIFDIVTLVIFPCLMVIGEAALLIFAVFCEIAAEMVCDAIFPRYEPIPAALLAKHDAPAASGKPEAAPAPAKAAVQGKNPRYGSAPIPAADRKAPFTPDLSARLTKIDADIPASRKLTQVIAPAVRTYQEELAKRDVEAGSGELRCLWLVVTRLIAKAFADEIENESDFITNSVYGMQREMPQILDGWKPLEMKNEYYKLCQDFEDSKKLIDGEHNDLTKELIAVVALFLDANRPDDGETEDLVDKLVTDAIKQGETLL